MSRRCGGQIPLGALANKGLTVRGAQMHGHRDIPAILDRMAKDEIVTGHLATHVLPLENGPHGYDIFKNKRTATSGRSPAWRVTPAAAAGGVPPSGVSVGRPPGGAR